MRTLALAAALFVLPSLAHADGPRPGHRKKVAGAALIGVGSALALVGQILLIDAAINPEHPAVLCPTQGPCAGPFLSPYLTFPGGLLTGIGGALLAAGIPVYVVGGAEAQRATVNVAELRF